MVISAAMKESTSEQANSPAMLVSPSQILDYSLKNNSMFTVDISIADAIEIMGCDFKLTFNGTVLDIVSVTSGDFFGASPHIWHNNTNNAESFVRFAMTPQAGTQAGKSGNGRLTTIEFRVEESGNSSIELKGSTKLSNSRGSEIGHTPLDSYFDNRHPADINYDRVVNVQDLTIVSLSYGYFDGEPQYNPIADINDDGVVDMRDLSFVARNLGWTWQ